MFVKAPSVQTYSPDVDLDYRLDGVVQWISEQLIDEVFELRGCVGVLYVRHAIATTPIPCWAIGWPGDESRVSDFECLRDEVCNTLSSNLQNGLMPLVSVVDAFSRTRSGQRSLALRLGAKENEDDHIVVTTPSLAADADPVVLDCELELVDAFGGRGFATVDTEGLDWSATLNSVAGDAWAADKLSCGAALAAKISDASKLEIFPHALIVRSLLAGLQEAVTYVGRGLRERRIHCVLEKPAENLGFAIGLQFWRAGEGGGPLPGDVFVKVGRCLSRLQKLLDGAFVKRTENSATKAMGGLAKYGARVSPDSAVPKGVLDRIAAGVHGVSAETPVNDDDFHRWRDVRPDIQRFLNFSFEFANETLEGEGLRYGLLLGEPFYTRFWPGDLPVVLDFGGAALERTTIDQIRKSVHVSAGPESRCVAVAYGAVCGLAHDKSGDGYLPLTHVAYSVDVSAYFRAMASSHVLSLRTPLQSAYAMLTYQCPWAVATIVGPGARQIVFNRGEVVAIRDGKGWYGRTSPVLDAYRMLSEGEGLSLQDARSLRVLAVALILAEQSSPLIREDAHGGFIVYRPEGALRDEEGEWRTDRIEAYDLGEAWKLERNGCWLLSRPLLKENALGEDSAAESYLQGLREAMDQQVASRALRALRLDGALVLKGELGEVEGYAAQLQVYADASQEAGKRDSPAGTKRLAAQRFVEAAGRGAFAIAVSSDGPVRVWCSAGEGLGVKAFELFRRDG